MLYLLLIKLINGVKNMLNAFFYELTQQIIKLRKIFNRSKYTKKQLKKIFKMSLPIKPLKIILSISM